MSKCLSARSARFVVPVMLVVMMGASAGCSPKASGSPAESGPALTGSTWVAEAIGGRGVLDNVRTTLSIDAGGQVTGLGGCNNYSGPAQVTSEAIRLGPMISTSRGCLPAIEDQERRFFSALASARRYGFTPEGKLVLYDESGSAIATLRRSTE